VLQFPISQEVVTALANWATTGANNSHASAGTIWAAASSFNHAEKRADFRSAGRALRKMYR
jgi:hypothetical protein